MPLKGSVFFASAMPGKTYQPVWSEKYRVRSWDISLSKQMRLSRVFSYFQEIANQHANHLDAGYDFMQQSGYVWVLSRVFIDIRRLPLWGEEFIVETWPLGNERVFFRRDFRLTSQSNADISAVTYWLLIDIASRRPKEFDIDEAVIMHNKSHFSLNAPSIRFLAVDSDIREIRKVKYSDIDQNLHVNNSRYVDWIFDLFEPSWLESKNPASFAIEYKSEVKEGDSVELYKKNEAGSLFHIEGKIAGSGKTSFRANIQFTR